jgi:hypothetical protein
VAVVVDVRVDHILEGEVFEPVERRLDIGPARADVPEKRGEV